MCESSTALHHAVAMEHINVVNALVVILVRLKRKGWIAFFGHE